MPPHLRQAAPQADPERGSSETDVGDSAKELNGAVNKVSIDTIQSIVPELFHENLLRGRGLLVKAVMEAQQHSPTYSNVYGALVAVINTKLPQIGELLVKRVVYNFKNAYKKRDKATATASIKFIAHLVNHYVAHEILALQLLAVLLGEPSDEGVEIAVNLLKEVGQRLAELSPQGLHAVFERLRAILHEEDIDKRVQYTIEGLFNVRKGGFAEYPAILEDLDLVEREEQITFEIGLEDDIDREAGLDVFKVDEKFGENERLWGEVKAELLGDEEEEGEEGEGDGEQEGEQEGGPPAAAPSNPSNPSKAGKGDQQIVDLTEQDLINLRRTIYLTIMSAASFEEGSHKLAKLRIPVGYEGELANMLIECCANEKSFQRHYGLMGQRLCLMNRDYRAAFCTAFAEQYDTVHRLETNKLRNVAKFFSHLARRRHAVDLPRCITLSESDTTSSSRIFVKILIQELTEALGLAEMRRRFSEPDKQDAYGGLFPKDTPRNTRFAINYFTSIGLGSLTDDLREYLKNAQATRPADASSARAAQSQGGGRWWGGRGQRYRLGLGFGLGFGLVLK